MAKPLKKVGITGSSGLIGGRLLCRGRNQYRFLRLAGFTTASRPQIADYVAEVKNQGAESILHLAWPASSTPGYGQSTQNFEAILKTIFLAEECERLALPLYAVGSGADDRLDSKNWYVSAKHITKSLISDRISDGSVTWIRPFHVFDGHSWPKYLQGLPAENIEIQDNRKRDFIHLDDVVEAIIVSLDNSIRGSIDVGTGKLRRPSSLIKAFGGKFKLAKGSLIREDDDFPRAILRQDLLDAWSPKYTNRLFR